MITIHDLKNIQTLNDSEMENVHGGIVDAARTQPRTWGEWIHAAAQVAKAEADVHSTPDGPIIVRDAKHMPHYD